MTNDIRKELASRITSIIMFTGFLIVSTMIWFNATGKLLNSSYATVLDSKYLKVVELTEGIKLTNAFPVVDLEGMKTKPYIFKIVNNKNESIKYSISFLNDMKEVTKDKCSVLANNYLRYTIKKDNDNYIEARNLTLDGIIYIDTIPANSEQTYSFIFWLDQNTGNEAQNKHFHGKVYINELKNDLVINN